jgi:acetoacetyl-CoA synthetase
LAPPLFDYVYQDISKKVLLGSITGNLASLQVMDIELNADVGIGGTDICSLFAGMNSALPVYKGEIQCRMLGMAIESYSPSGSVNAPEEPGELVCTRPFPCMPLGFWPLPGYGVEAAVKAANERFFQSYFSEFEGVWCKLHSPDYALLNSCSSFVPFNLDHGDHVIVTRSRDGNGGGLIMMGRSDGVL